MSDKQNKNQIAPPTLAHPTTTTVSTASDTNTPIDAKKNSKRKIFSLSLVILAAIFVSILAFLCLAALGMFFLFYLLTHQTSPEYDKTDMEARFIQTAQPLFDGEYEAFFAKSEKDIDGNYALPGDNIKDITAFYAALDALTNSGKCHYKIKEFRDTPSGLDTGPATTTAIGDVTCKNSYFHLEITLEAKSHDSSDPSLLSSFLVQSNNSTFLAAVPRTEEDFSDQIEYTLKNKQSNQEPERTYIPDGYDLNSVIASGKLGSGCVVATKAPMAKIESSTYGLNIAIINYVECDTINP